MKRNSEYSRFNLVHFDGPCAKTSVPKCMAEELVDEVFSALKDASTNYDKISSSDCRIYQHKQAKPDRDDDDDMDPRLKCWKKMLRERKQLQERIARRTGKRTEDVLFNRHSTIDEPTKQMLIRLLDTAQRSEGIPQTSINGVLRMRQDTEQCREIRELLSTKPKLNMLEFVGLPEVTQMELAATKRPVETQWQRSEVLGARLEAQVSNIRHVLSHCPELEHLQVSTLANPYDIPVLDSKRLGEEMMYLVSTETSEESMPVGGDTSKDQPQPQIFEKSVINSQWTTDNLISINGRKFGFGDNSGALSSDAEFRFECEPLQHVRHTIVQLENIGSKFIHIRWLPSYLKGLDLQQQTASSQEFLFNTQPFVLMPGERHRIDVMYQPMVVGIKKQRWCMHMLRSPFCGIRRYFVQFHGTCILPALYRDRLDRDQRLVIDKRNRQVTERLAKMHGELAPLVEHSTVKCPYQRTLDERELFCIQNTGYKCERYADLETLKQLYTLVKKPRQPPWDYRLDTLRQCIYQHEVKQRESLQKILVDVLGPMRCSSDELPSELQANQQRNRSCFLYVRGIVCTTVEDWESLSEGLGQQFFKSELQLYMRELEAEGKNVPRDRRYVEWLVSRKVLASKYFKDALYIQTYTMVCDAAENIVSAIESTMNS